MTSNIPDFIPDDATTEKWESGEYGLSLEHVGVVPEEASGALDASLGLQLVSIRLQRSLIKNLKLIAKYRGVAYQPLVRDLLNRFATSELKDIFHELEAAQRQAAAEGSIVEDFITREQDRKRA